MYSSRERGDIGAGCGKSIDNDDHGLLALQFTQGAVKLLGTGSRSTGTINVDDRRARQSVQDEPVPRRDPDSVRIKP